MLANEIANYFLSLVSTTLSFLTAHLKSCGNSSEKLKWAYEEIYQPALQSNTWIWFLHECFRHRLACFWHGEIEEENSERCSECLQYCKWTLAWSWQSAGCEGIHLRYQQNWSILFVRLHNRHKKKEYGRLLMVNNSSCSKGQEFYCFFSSYFPFYGQG